MSVLHQARPSAGRDDVPGRAWRVRLQTVSGRLCSRTTSARRASIAHSMSCGRAVVLLGALGQRRDLPGPRRRSAPGCARRSSSTSRSVTQPAGQVGDELDLLAAQPSSSTTSSMTLSTSRLSGVTVPLTTLSPSPKLASIAIFERSPLDGFSVIATPAARAGDHPLDGDAHLDVVVRDAAVRAVGDRAGGEQAAPSSGGRARRPRRRRRPTGTCPAGRRSVASAPSSAVALERTATGTSSPSAA